jgi:hypothetical protein
MVVREPAGLDLRDQGVIDRGEPALLRLKRPQHV